MRRLGGIAAVLALFACAVAPASAAATVVPIEGPWSARTSDGLPVTFEVAGTSVTNLVFSFRQTVCGTDTLRSAAPVPIEPSGHWLYQYYPGLDVQGTFVAADRFEGTVEVPGRSTPSCGRSLATFVATPGATPPPPPPLRLNDGRGNLVRRPHEVVASRDGSFYFYGLRWSGLGGEEAHAVGRAYVHRKGVLIRPRVELTLSSLETFAEYRTYETLGYRLLGPLPPGIDRSGSRLLPKPKPAA